MSEARLLKVRRIKHDDQPRCANCDAKLNGAHPDIAQWFWEVKKRWPLAHISWAYRSEVDQDLAVENGLSLVRYPASPHNFTMNGKPCSLALDLFEQLPNGVGRWDPKFYADIIYWSDCMEYPVQWGGRFKHLGDANHFQLDKKKLGLS